MMFMIVIMFMFMVVMVFVVMLMVVVMFVVMLMVVVMMMFTLLLTIDHYADVCTSDTAFYGLLDGVLNSRYADRAELVSEFIWLRQKLQQSSCEHITCGTHTTV
jgi:hypothetical protein